jgi:hypothetical protein
MCSRVLLQYSPRIGGRADLADYGELFIPGNISNRVEKPFAAILTTPRRASFADPGIAQQIPL